MDELTRAVSEALGGAGLLCAGARVLAAVSGGADSVALLMALCRASRETGVTVSACHVQHGLRGQASLEDERFTRELCQRLGVQLFVENARLKGGMDDPGAETRARNERMRLFAKLMREGGYQALLTAHHLNDQAETALMRLLRGAGTEGLRGIRPCAPFACGVVLRPFLNISKRDILRALESNGMTYRTDESNLVPSTPRNALRLDVMPRLEELFPGAQRHIAQAAEALRADEDYLSAQADALYLSALYRQPPILALRLKPLDGAPDALRRRALRRLYADALAASAQAPDERALGYGDTLRLSALLTAPYGTRLNLPCGLMALRGQRDVHLLWQSGQPLEPTDPQQPLAVTPDRAEYALCGIRIRLSPCVPQADPPRDACSVWLSPDILAQAPVLRASREGDSIHPFGAGGSKPLRRYLTDRKLDAPYRAVLPVLAVGSRVLWLPALCADEGLRATAPVPGTLCLRLTGGAPYLP